MAPPKSMKIFLNLMITQAAEIYLNEDETQAQIKVGEVEVIPIVYLGDDRFEKMEVDLLCYLKDAVAKAALDGAVAKLQDHLDGAHPENEAEPFRPIVTKGTMLS